MTDPVRLTGFAGATPNAVSKDVRFILETENAENPIYCIGQYNLILRIASGLGAALHMLRLAFLSQGETAVIPADRVSDVYIQKDYFSDAVLVQITSEGIPYTFHFSDQIASKLADELKNQLASRRPIGSA
jgi:hypothetical protein